jgi:hypothetical protein
LKDRSSIIEDKQDDSDSDFDDDGLNIINIPM